MNIANDNAPKQTRMENSVQAYRPVIAQRSSLRENPNLPESVRTNHQSIEQDDKRSLHLTIGCWVAAIICMVATFGLGLSTGAKLFSSIALLWTGLWSSYITADHGQWRLSEVSVVTALAGLLGTILISANFFELGLTLSDGLILMAILPLFIGHLLGSRICVLASICAVLILGALHFFGLTENSNFLLSVPLICAAQIYAGTRIHSGLAITLAVITSYYWILGITVTAWIADDLPLTFAFSTLFILGVAHHRSGKAAEDKRVTGSSVHIYVGWIAAMIGAVGFQYFWLIPEAFRNSTASISMSGMTIWKIVTAAALATIFCSAIIRYKHTQISMIGIFLLTAISAIIPMMLWFPGWSERFSTAVPGTSLIPTIGVLIGASLTATAIGMCLNGVRRHAPIMIGMGITVLFAQAYLLLKPELLTIDNGVIFAGCFLTALAVGAIIAGTSISHQAPAPRFKHS